MKIAVCFAVWTICQGMTYPQSITDPTKELIRNTYKCPVLKFLLFEFFQGFPDIDSAQHAVQISPSDFDSSLVKAVKIYNFLGGNLRVTLDELTEDMARVVLEKRMNCSVTMFQHILVYVLRSEFSDMLNSNQNSLYKNINDELQQRLSSTSVAQTEMENIAKQIVSTVNFIVFESLASYLQYQQFESLDMFLEDISKHAHVYFSDDSITDKYTAIMTYIIKSMSDFSPSFTCPSMQDLIRSHSRITNDFIQQYVELENSGMVLHLLKNIILEMLKPLKVRVLDSSVMDQAADKLAVMAVGFMKTKLQVLQDHETKISSMSPENPPDFILNRLSDVQKQQVQTLLRAIGNGELQTGQTTTVSTTVDSPGTPTKPTLRDMASSIVMDIRELRLLYKLLEADNYLGQNSNKVYKQIRDTLRRKSTSLEVILQFITVK